MQLIAMAHGRVQHSREESNGVHDQDITLLVPDRVAGAASSRTPDPPYPKM